MCLDCGHKNSEHDLTPDAPCLIDECECTSLHLDMGDCTPKCHGDDDEQFLTVIIEMG